MEKLVTLAERLTSGEPEKIAFPTPLVGLTLLRSNFERSPNLVLYRPALCIVLQGEKRTYFGAIEFSCKAGEAVLVGISTPALGRVVQASQSEPYIGVVLELDMPTLREVLEEIEMPELSDEEVKPGVFHIGFEGHVADCIRRMLELAETPKAIPMIAPALMREFCYWLLTGSHGAEVTRFARLTGPTRAIVDTIHILRERYTETLRVEDLAKAANMSPSAYHLRFKAFTLTSPIQYQKQLRLHEARRLLFAGEANVESAALQVGYESASQFSREYTRAFGLSPRRDALSRRASFEVPPAISA